MLSDGDLDSRGDYVEVFLPSAHDWKFNSAVFPELKDARLVNGMIAAFAILQIGEEEIQLALMHWFTDDQPEVIDSPFATICVLFSNSFSFASSFLSLLRVCVLLLFLGVSMDMSMDVLRGE
jgi:hypothetical protein